jgi:hypothetical protein
MLKWLVHTTTIRLERIKRWVVAVIAIATIFKLFATGR